MAQPDPALHPIFALQEGHGGGEVVDVRGVRDVSIWIGSVGGMRGVRRVRREAIVERHDAREVRRRVGREMSNRGIGVGSGL